MAFFIVQILNFMFVNIHTHSKSINSTELEIINIDNVIEFDASNHYCSIGIHPWKINKSTYEEELNILKKISSQKNIAAIGECGLDKLTKTDLLIQEFIFKTQISIAESVQKPLIIHCVKAFDELIRIKKKMSISVPIIVHAYNNNKQILAQLLKNGFYISLGKALLKSNSNASKIISLIPPERLFLETDDADLPIKTIFDSAAKYLNQDLEVLKQQIYNNYKKVFIHE